MLLGIPVLLLLLAAAVMVALSRWRPQFAYHWPVALAGALLAWISVFVLRSRMPLSLPVLTWGQQGGLLATPGLILDAVSWQFALALAALMLAVILTDAGRYASAQHASWIVGLLAGALGLLTVLSGDPVTLVLSWTALDLLVLLFLLWRVSDEGAREAAITAFAGAVLSSLALLAGIALGSGTDFAALGSGGALFALLAVGLRLGGRVAGAKALLPPNVDRGLGVALYFTQLAGPLVLLVRLGEAALPFSSLTLFVLLFLAALYAALVWLRAEDELAGRPFWGLGVAALVGLAALHADPNAALALATAGIALGALLLLASARQRGLLPVFLLAFLALSTLPLSPTSPWAALYTPPFSPLLLAFALPYALLLLGYLRQALGWQAPLSGVERWVGTAYHLGLAVLLLVPWGAALLSGFISISSPLAYPFWLGLVLIGLTGVVWLLDRRGLKLPPAWAALWDRISPHRWLGGLARWLYGLLARALDLPVTLLEGQAGVLWTFLLVALLFSLLGQFRAGR